MGVTVRISYGALPREMMRGGTPHPLVEAAQRAAIRSAGPFVQRVLAFNTPSGSGKSRQSVIFEEGRRPDTGFVTWSAPSSTYIGFANDGTRPHFPPFGPIALWARRKGLPAGAVWWSIARKGTRPQRFIERTVAQVRRPAQQLMASAARAALSGRR